MGRNTYGMGSVRQRANGRWEGTVSLGYDANGKRIRKSVSAATREQAIMEMALARQHTPSPDTLTVGMLLDVHARRLDAAVSAGSITPETRDTWRYATARCDPIKDTLVSLVTPAWIEDWSSSLTGSSSTRRKTFQVLKAAFDTGVHHQLVTVTPFASAKAPSAAAPDAAHATASDVRLLLEQSQDPWRMLWLILAYTGLRPGEGRQLRWEDIDTDSPACVRVVHGKTVRSIRAVPLVPEVADYLSQRSQPSGWLLPNRKGTGPVDRWTVIRHFKAVLPDLTPHSLRHGAATRLLDAGVPVHDVAAILGHSTPSITLSVYAHSVSQRQAEALRRTFGG